MISTYFAACGYDTTSAAPPVPAGQLFLSPKHREVLRKASHAVLPGDPPWPNPDEIGVVDRVDRHLAWMSAAEPAITSDFKTLLGLIEWWPVFPGFRFSRFTRMTVEQARRELLRWRSSGLGFRLLGFNAIKSVCAFYYFGDPRVFAHLPYGGTWKDKYGIAPVEVPGLVESDYHP